MVIVIMRVTEVGLCSFISGESDDTEEQLR